MHRPDFGKKFFEKHQQKLVDFANTWLGKRFFQFRKGFGISDTFRVMALYPNAVSGDWKYEKGRLIKRTIFSTDNHYQMRFEHAYRWLSRFLPLSAAQLLEPSTSLAFTMPLFALTVFNPDADPESTSVDGFVRRSGVDENIATISTGNGSSSGDAGSTGVFTQIIASGTTNQFNNLDRFICLFDTSSIPDTDDVSAAVISFYSYFKVNESGGTLDVDCVASSPASNTSLASGDFQTMGSTVFGSVAYGSVGTNVYTDITLDANGRNAVIKTGVSKYGFRFSWDTDGTFGGTWGSGRQDAVFIRHADFGSNKPKLDVTHAAATSSAVGFFTML